MASFLVNFILFVIGLCFGSFLNVLVYRLNHGLSPLRGRSICPKCKHPLAWKDNIPLLSFFLLKGKCHYCQSPISWQYPIVELTTGILTVAVFFLSGNSLITYYLLLITYSLIAIFVSDLLYYTIPDKIVYPTLLFALIYLISQSPNIFFSNFLISLTAAGFFYFLVLITHGRGMGMGDVKLVALIGLVLGWQKMVVALYLAFLTGALIGVILVTMGKRRLNSHVPFGPFLAGSTWVALFWGDQIFERCKIWLLG